jgi:hypothetical protein
MIKRLATLAILIAATLAAACSRSEQTSGDSVGHAFQQRLSDVAVEGDGIVTRTLKDDRDGSPHQRFIVRLASGQTVLIEHNIDIAPRIGDLKAGDSIGFSGEYVWNEQGGLVHWTHHDPVGRHTAGWIKHNGRTYQ